MNGRHPLLTLPMVGDEQLKSGSKKGGKRHFELFLGIFTSPTLLIET